MNYAARGFTLYRKIKQYVTMFIISLVLYVVNLLSIRIVTKKDVAVANILFLKESKRIKKYMEVTLLLPAKLLSIK